MLGKAAVAMWWDVAPEMRAEWEDWHSSEHMPERLAIPGFLRGTRWIAESGEPSYFVLYEVDAPGDDHRRRIPRAAEQSHAVVAKDDAAPSQHGAQPVRAARGLGRRVAAGTGHDPLLAATCRAAPSCRRARA